MVPGCELKPQTQKFRSRWRPSQWRRCQQLNTQDFGIKELYEMVLSLIKTNLKSQITFELVPLTFLVQEGRFLYCIFLIWCLPLPLVFYIWAYWEIFSVCLFFSFSVITLLQIWYGIKTHRVVVLYNDFCCIHSRAVCCIVFFVGHETPSKQLRWCCQIIQWS